MKLFTIKNTKLIGRNTLLLTLQPQRNRDRLRFYPGQYAAIGYKRRGRPSLMRCFSIVSSPNSTDEVQFATRIRGNFTQALSELEIGDTVFMHGPFGNFVIDEQYDRNIMLMAAGIGITPFMSMLRFATETKLAIPMTLLYTCRSQDDIPFYEELMDLERQNPRLKIAFLVTDGNTSDLKGARALSGRLDEARLGQVTNGQYNRFTYFICGPKPFTEDMQAILESHETDPTRIITEEFTPSSHVNAVSSTPRYSISRWTYGLTGVALVLGTVFMMTIDLARAIPRLSNAAASQAATTSQSQPVTSTTSSPTTSSNSTASNQSPSSTTTQQTATQPAQTYQAPVTSVS